MSDNIIPLPPQTPVVLTEAEYLTLQKSDIEALIDDRNQWQSKAQNLAADLQVTELALGDTMTTVTDLVNGHNRLIGLLQAITADAKWPEVGAELREQIGAALSEVKVIDPGTWQEKTTPITPQ
jgi:hypothetical protein